jgi:hypothetical protein
MRERAESDLTRARLLRGALAGGAIVAGGMAIGRGGGGTSLASPSPDMDDEILRLLIGLERVQAAFYDTALERAGLDGRLRRFAETVARQEHEHVGFLTDRLRGAPPKRPRSDFGAALSDPQRFRDASIELEEAAIAAYIGQGANLTAPLMRDVAPLVSVEARQVAWVRDIAGVSPAPRAADPAREPGAVLAELRRKGFME